MERYLWVLKDAERDLVRDTQPERLVVLDEDGLSDLHKRVRRARDKHTSNYRRAAAGNVEKAGGRSAARKANATAKARAYVFEDALARVSEALAHAAQEQAQLLRDERLAQARESKGGKKNKGPAKNKKSGRKAATKSGKKSGKKSGEKAATKSGKKSAKVKSAKAGRTGSPKDKPANKRRAASTAAAGSRAHAKRDAR